MKIRVTRAFCVAGVRQEVGTELTVTDAAGRELLQMGKAERIDGAAAAPAGPMTTVTAAAAVKGKAAKEPTNVSQ